METLKYLTFCAFGDETDIEAFIPYFNHTIYEFEAFKENERYPLKQRADRSADESAKRCEIGSLEYRCRTNLPGDYNRNFKTTGRCTLSDAKAFYYASSESSTGTAVQIFKKQVSENDPALTDISSSPAKHTLAVGDNTRKGY